MDLYFSKKYTPESNVVRTLGDSVVAAGQWFNYDTLVAGKELKSVYLSGLATLPERRGRGYASSIIRDGIQRAYIEGASLAWVIPATEELCQFYSAAAHGSFYMVASRFEHTFVPSESVPSGYEVLPLTSAALVMPFLYKCLAHYGAALMPSLNDVEVALSLVKIEQGHALYVRRGDEVCAMGFVVKNKQGVWRISFMESVDLEAEKVLLNALFQATGVNELKAMLPLPDDSFVSIPYAMARVVDVEKFFQIMAPTLSDQTVCIEVVPDYILPHCGGRYLFENGTVQPTDRPPHYTLRPGMLAYFFLARPFISLPMMLDE